MAHIKHYLTIKAPAETVCRAVTEQEGLASWWTTGTTAVPEVGADIEFRFGDRYHNVMKVLTLEPNRRVEWECIKGEDEWVGTRFHFDIEQADGHVVLRFSHSVWREETDFFASCNFNWGYYLKSLILYGETGTGTPFQHS